LIHVDYATQRRTVKTSGKWYAEIVRDRGAMLCASETEEI
jgi:beta-glucosidase